MSAPRLRTVSQPSTEQAGMGLQVAAKVDFSRCVTALSMDQCSEQEDDNL